MIRAGISAALVALMLGFGLAVYGTLDAGRHLHTTVAQPTSTHYPTLPGVIYLAQGGSLYRFQAGTFTKLTPAEGWTQPAISADGTQLVAVKRGFNFSDLYLLDPAGHVQRQLTHNAAGVVERNHWAFYPRFSADGQTVFYSYDPKDPSNSYRVDLSIMAQALGSQASPRQWSNPNHYTGGDVEPVPLASGLLLYTKYSIDAQGKEHSQLWVQARAGSAGVELTKPEDDCGQPAVAPDGAAIAMTCRHGQATTDLEIAAWNASNFTLGTPAVVVPAGLVARPAFSPDGHSLAYFAPTSGAGAFQLWTVGLPEAGSAASPSPAPAPAAPREITKDLGLDSAAMAWR